MAEESTVLTLQCAEKRSKDVSGLMGVISRRVDTLTIEQESIVLEVPYAEVGAVGLNGSNGEEKSDEELGVIQSVEATIEKETIVIEVPLAEGAIGSALLNADETTDEELPELCDIVRSIDSYSIPFDMISRITSRPSAQSAVSSTVEICVTTPKVESLENKEKVLLDVPYVEAAVIGSDKDKEVDHFDEEAGPINANIPRVDLKLTEEEIVLAVRYGVVRTIGSDLSDGEETIDDNSEALDDYNPNIGIVSQAQEGIVFDEPYVEVEAFESDASSGDESSDDDDEERNMSPSNDIDDGNISDISEEEYQPQFGPPEWISFSDESDDEETESSDSTEGADGVDNESDFDMEDYFARGFEADAESDEEAELAGLPVMLEVVDVPFYLDVDDESRSNSPNFDPDAWMVNVFPDDRVGGPDCQCPVHLAGIATFPNTCIPLRPFFIRSISPDSSEASY